MISPQERQAYAEVLLGCNGIERQLAFNANQTILTDWTFLFFDEPASLCSYECLTHRDVLTAGLTDVLRS